MATEQTLEIKYMVKAVDDASKTLENIEKELQIIIKTNKNVEKANEALTESFKNQSESIQNTQKDINQASTNLNKYKLALAAVAVAGTQFYYSIYNKEVFTAFNLAVLNAGDSILKISDKFGKAILNFKQGDSILSILGSRISSVFLLGKKYIDDFGKIVVNSAFDLAKYNTFGELAAEGIFKVSDASFTASQKIKEIITNSQPLQQISSKFIQLAKDTGPLNASLTKLNQVFQLLIKTFPQFFNIVQLGFEYLGKQSFILGIKAQGAVEELNKLANTGKSVGGAIAEAAKRTEPLQSGLIATVSKATLLAGVFTALGTALITSDSIMGKLTGITLLGLSIALAGLAVVIQQVLTYMGKFIASIGEKMVESMQEATKAASQAQQQLFTFKFIIDSLNESTNGATGSFAEWSDVVDEFSQSTKFMTGDVQQSVSEIIRFGNSIGLSKEQMKKLLPVIGDLAAANHKDLYSSTIAVLEGLNGQTQSLQNMGVNLTQASVQNSHFAKGLGKTVQSLTPLQQAQLRYNLLLEDVVPISGLAVKSLGTVEGSLKSQEYSWIQLQKQMGSGSNIIETKVNLAFAALYDTLSLLPQSILSTAGFFADFGGRALQVIGTIIELSFEISLLATSIGALNVLLKNQTIQKFFISISNSSFFMREINGTFDQLIVNIGKAFNTVGTKGLGITSFFTLLTQVVRLALSQVLALTIALAPYVALFVAIASAGYLLYQAFVRIEEETKLFSNTWQSLKQFMTETGFIDTIISGLQKLQKGFEYIVKYGIDLTATAIIYLINVYNDLKIAFIKIKTIASSFADFLSDKLSKSINNLAKIYNSLLDAFLSSEIYKYLQKVIIDLSDAFDYLGEKIAQIIDYIISKFENIKNAVVKLVPNIKRGFLELVGITNAYAEDNSALYDSILKVINAHGTLSKAQIAAVLGYSDASKVTDKYAQALKNSNYQIIQEQIAHERAGDIIDNVVKAKSILSEEDQKNIALINQQTIANDQALQKLREKLYAEEKVTNAVKKGAEAQAKAAITQNEALKQVNSTLAAIKMSAAENIVFNFSIASVRTGLTQIVEKIDEIKKKIKDAKDEELPGFIKQLKELQEKAIEIEFIGKVSGLLGILGSIQQGAVNLLKTASSAIATAIAGPLGTIIGDMIGQFIDIFGKAPDEFRKMFVETFKQLPQLIGNIIENIANFVDIILGDALTGLIDQLPNLVERIILVLTTRFSDPGFVASLALGIAKAFVKAIPLIVQNFIKGLRDGLQKGLFGRIAQLGVEFGNLAKVFNKIGKFFTTIFEEIKKNLKFLLIPLIVALAPLIIAIGLLYLTIKNFDKIVQFFNSIIKFTVDFFIKLPQLMLNALSILPRLILDSFISAFNYITSGLQVFINGVVNGLQTLFVFLTNLPKILLDGITSGFLSITNILNKVYTNFTNLIASIPQATLQFINQIFSAAVSFTSKLLSGVDLFIKRLFKGADDFVGAIVRGAGQFISELIKGIGKAGSSLLPNLPGGNLLNQAGNAINNAVNTVQEFVDDITPWSTGGIPALTAAGGMIVPGSSTQGDRIPVRVNSREMILNLDQQARLFKMLQGQMNSNSESRPIEIHTTVQLDNRQLGKSIERLTLNGWQK